MLPQISPSPLTSLKEPIGHPNWIYELKHDAFRGILNVDREQAWLVRAGERSSVSLIRSSSRFCAAEKANA
jgi:ATP-dependent DNA ligase